MPQDKRRTISYRSFVTCDNPKGVVECGAIRKSKISSQKKEQQHQQSFKVVEGGKKVGNANTKNTSLALIKEDKKKMCIQEITRELDVSKGAHKMNHVINSWSKEKGNQEEIIAKDLLRGALDLQESLVMLGKLQEKAFSSLMSRSRRKNKHKVEEGSFDSMINGVNNETLQMGFQRPGKSTDEMKKVVRDSLLRQNVITNPIFEEHFDHRMRGCSYMPSTSSSHSSSMVRSSNFVPSDSSSSSSSISQRRKKDSNLIFKLMGLESPPLSPRWHKEEEKFVNLRKPMYEVDSPRARKCQYGAQVLGNKQRSVEEILETLQFKGLLRSSSGNGMTPNAAESEVFSLKNGLYDERPPIVIMKPFMPKFWLKRTITDSGANFREEGAKKTGFCKANDSVNRDLKLQTKHESPRKLSGVEKVSHTRRKGEENKDAKFRDVLSFCDQEKLLNTPKLIKQKDGRFISKQKDVTCTSIYDHRKEEICEISGHRKKNRQLAFVEDNKKRKGKEKEIEVVYTEGVVTSCDNNNVLPVAKSIMFDSFLEQNQSKERRNQIRDYNVDASTEHRQNDKMLVCDIALSDTHEHGNGYVDNHSYSEITSVSTSEHYSPVCEVTLVTTHENGVPVHVLGDKSPSFPYENKPELSKESLRTKLQTLLLCNLSILNNPEDLYDIQVFPDLAPYDVGRDRVLIDYANEVIKLKSSEFSHSYLPQKSIKTKETQNLPSLDQLLEEIGNGIEDLKRYHRSASDDKFSSDSLYLILDRDLSFKSEVWEIGWKRVFSQDELELVVREVDKLILGKLIEEIVLDLMVL